MIIEIQFTFIIVRPIFSIFVNISYTRFLIIYFGFNVFKYLNLSTKIRFQILCRIEISYPFSGIILNNKFAQNFK